MDPAGVAHDALVKVVLPLAAPGLFTAGISMGIGKLVTGQASVKEMGGPGTIGVMAYRAAQSGWRSSSAATRARPVSTACSRCCARSFRDRG